MRVHLLTLSILILCLILFCKTQCSGARANPNETINYKAPFYTNTLLANHPRISKIYDSSKLEFYYPFMIYTDGSYLISAEIDDLELDQKYRPLFSRNGYSGNGYSWESHIIQILEREKPDLLKHVQLDPESGGFYAYADSEYYQRAFVAFLSPIFKDTLLLEKYLKKANRGLIDD